MTGPLSPPMRALLRGLWAAAAFAVGVMLLRRLSSFGDWRAAWSKSVEQGPAVLLLLAMPAVGHFLKMLGWRNLLPPAVRPGVARSYATFVGAQAVNELGFSVLGEPLKVMVLPSRARADGLRAVVYDNLASLVALLVVVATLLVSGWLAPAVVAASATSLRWLAAERRRRLVWAFVAHYAGKLWLVAEIALGLRVLGEASLAPAAPLSLAWLGAAALGAPVPGQLGVVEAALVQSGTVLGIAAPSLLALALIRRVRGGVWLVLGLLLAARVVPRQREGELDVPTTFA